MSGKNGEHLLLDEVAGNSHFEFEYDAEGHQLVIEIRFSAKQYLGVSSTKIYIPLQDLTRLEQTIKSAKEIEERRLPRTVGGMVPMPSDTVPTLLSGRVLSAPDENGYSYVMLSDFPYKNIDWTTCEKETVQVQEAKRWPEDLVWGPDEDDVSPDVVVD